MIARWLALLLVAFTAPVTAQPSSERPRSAQPIAPERQILVMLRLAPPHFRAGSAYAGGYGDDQSRGGRRRIAAAIASRYGLTLAGNWPMPVIGLDCFVMTTPAGRDAAAASAEVSRDGAVEWAQPVALFRTLGADSADPLFAAQPVAKAWRLAALHRVATGRRVTIAVIDSQVDLAHPDLAGQIVVARNFVDGRASGAEDHGTGVAGVIAAKAANGIGIAGVAPGARLYALRACWQPARAPTVCDTLSLAKAIAFAVERRTDVVNLSLGGPADRLLATLLKTGMNRGTRVVAAYDAAANDGGFPASLTGVIAVAAAPFPGARGPYWAPGRDIPTTQPGGRWYLVSGASYAAAEVSGLLALLQERYGVAAGARGLISTRVAGGEIDGCATLLGMSPACGKTGSATASIRSWAR